MSKRKLVTLLFALGSALVAASVYFPRLAPFATMLALLMRSPFAVAFAQGAGVEIPVTEMPPEALPKGESK